MHRSATALGAAASLAKKFCHTGAPRPATRKEVSMAAIRGNYIILGFDNRKGSDCNCLLPDVEVKEPANLSLCIKPRRLFFETAYSEHLPIKVSDKILI